MHIKNIHCMIEELAEGLKNNVTKSMKLEEVETIGKVVDMLKDLSEAEYYSRISKAMEESEKEDEQEAKAMMKRMKDEYGDEEGERMYRMGYNSRRYANGRYAPKGRGRRMGYMPPEMRIPYFEDEDYMMDDMSMMRMGYGTGNRGGNMNMGGNRGGNMDGGSRGGNNGSYGYSDGRGEGSRHGQSYDNYRTARRHFTETKDMDSKKKMEESMKDYTNDVMDNIKEMWHDAEPALRQSTKTDLLKFVQQLA